MAQLQVNPTRMELKKIQARYTTARRGHKLLKDKRDELMKKYLEHVREDKVLRERVEAALAQFQGSFGIASATASPLMLKEALILPKKEGWAPAALTATPQAGGARPESRMLLLPR